MTEQHGSAKSLKRQNMEWQCKTQCRVRKPVLEWSFAPRPILTLDKHQNRL